ncbi:hypothetical protein ACNOYE_33050 [Nannocystaceae bacterium ST9]
MKVQHAVLGVVASLACPACFEPPNVDLEGPRIMACSLATPRSVEVSVQPTITIELSEPLDPASVHAGSVGLFAWEPVGDCSLTPLCDEGSCERGRCMVDPVRATDRNALDEGELEAPAIALEFELGEGPAGPQSVLSIRPVRPLAEHARHTLILGAAVRDRGGAGLSDERGQVHAFALDFVTASVGSAGPEPSLVAPLPGELAVPTNLARVELRVHPPVPWPQPDATIELEDDVGDRVRLIDPQPCVDWLPGSCVSLRPERPLAPDRRHRPAGGTLVDRLGRPATIASPDRETWFATDSGPDLEPPAPESIAELRGRCLVVWIAGDEVLLARLAVGEAVREQVLTPGVAAIGLASDDAQPGESIAWTLALRDRADNHAELAGELVAGPGFDPELPRLVFSEVLGNPLGPEPDAEFVELLALAGPADTTGLLLSDRSPDELFASWARGDDPPGDPLPAITLDQGQPALIVASSWAPGLGGDPSPPASTPLIVLDGSLGSGGIANAGEPLTLWSPSEQGPVIVARYANWIDTSAKAHSGRSVVADPDGCDLPDRWRSHPLASSSPGTLP